jgi:hypothetical protein
VTQVVKHLPSRHEALSSTLSSTNTKQSKGTLKFSLAVLLWPMVLDLAFPSLLIDHAPWDKELKVRR